MGDGPSYKTFRNLIDQHNLQNEILLLKHINHGHEFKKIIKLSDIYVLPNRATGISIGRSG